MIFCCQRARGFIRITQEAEDNVAERDGDDADDEDSDDEFDQPEPVVASQTAQLSSAPHGFRTITTRDSDARESVLTTRQSDLLHGIARDTCAEHLAGVVPAPHGRHWRVEPTVGRREGGPLADIPQYLRGAVVR